MRNQVSSYYYRLGLILCIYYTPDIKKVVTTLNVMILFVRIIFFFILLLNIYFFFFAEEGLGWYELALSLDFQQIAKYQVLKFKSSIFTMTFV